MVFKKGHKREPNSGSFKKGHKLSKTSIEKISLAKKGKPSPMKGKKTGHIPWNKGMKGVYKQSEETKKKLRGKTPWNKGKKGPSGPKNAFFGKKHTEESRKKMSRGQKKRFADPRNHPMYGRKMTEETRRKNSEAKKKWFAEGGVHPMKGKKMTEETKRKIKETKMKRYPDGQPVWNKGKKGVFSKESRKKMSLAHQNPSAETRRKMSLAKKDHVPWNKGKKTGHIPWNKGKKMSEEHRKKLSRLQQSDKIKKKIKETMMKRYPDGRKTTEETKRKIKETMMKRYPDGIKMTEETKRKVKETMKKRYPDGRKHTEESKRKMSELAIRIMESKRKDQKGWNEWRKKIAVARASQVFPLKDTEPEKLLQKLLRDQKIKFETHRKFVKRGVRIYGQPDIFIEPNLCIFVDGDYWHCNPNDFIYRKKQMPGFKPNDQITGKRYAKDKWAKDKAVNDRLKKEGYTILRFWHSELEQNPKKHLQKILNEIKKS